MDFDKKLPIVEVYSCVQSEGKLSGIPHILIRTTGCTLRCQFSGTDFCDSWYTSWKPDKGSFSWNEIEEVLDKHPLINHVMITGGSPTMHPELLQFMTNTLHQKGYHITLETEGSKYVPNCHVDLLSLSPKLSNSKPRVGTKTPMGREVTDKDLKKHEKLRQNYGAMADWILNSKAYQFKPVITATDNEQTLTEIEKLINLFDIPHYKVWLMAAGGDKETLESNLEGVLNLAVEKGWNFVPRFHILIFDDKRGV